MANGRKEAVVRVLERAARVNRRDLTAVLKTLQDSDKGSEHTSGSHRLSSLLHSDELITSYSRMFPFKTEC